MQDLNELLEGPLAQFVTLNDASGFNDAGAIAGTGKDSRYKSVHAYLLTPVN
ncbi:MAG TPA: hypothetical protein VMG11_02090 [Steroidobacteraceae bacterium]|nr:hypothetical protein [Steroidobacteraceae bacterium]